MASKEKKTTPKKDAWREVSEKSIMTSLIIIYGVDPNDQKESRELKENVLDPLWEDFELVLKQLQQGSLTDKETLAIKTYWDQHAKLQTEIQQQDFVDLSIVNVDDDTIMRRVFTQVHGPLALSVRLASHLDKNTRPYQSIHWANA